MEFWAYYNLYGRVDADISLVPTSPSNASHRFLCRLWKVAGRIEGFLGLFVVPQPIRKFRVNPSQVYHGRWRAIRYAFRLALMPFENFCV